MNILHVDTERGFRGGEQQLLWLVENLLKIGIKATVACRKEGELYKRCKEKNIKTVALVGNQIIDSIKIARLGHDFDIIHAHAAKAHTICAFAKIFNKKPLIYTRRVDYKPKDNAVTRFKYKNTDKIIAISKFVANMLNDFLKTGQSLEVLEDAVDMKLGNVYYVSCYICICFSAVDMKLGNRIDNKRVLSIRESFNQDLIVGSVAALTDQKNIPNLIKAADYVIKRYPKSVFVVLGEGKLRGKLEDMIEKAGLSDKFKLLGFKRDVENYIKAFDIFVLPSDFEGLGSSLLIAMVLHVPVVATDAGGVGEVVINGKTGLLVEKNNPWLLAKGITKIIENPELGKRLADNAYRFVTENFSVENMTKGYLSVYRALIED